MIVSAIVAKSDKNIIGSQNKMIWSLPTDLARFKKITTGHAIIMGRKTFESIGQRLPNRLNIVLTRQIGYVAPYCVVCNNLYEALGKASTKGNSEVFIIGGGEIYRQSQKLWDKLYITEVHAEIEGDTTFPRLIKNQWSLVSSVFSKADANNEFDTTFKILERL